MNKKPKYTFLHDARIFAGCTTQSAFCFVVVVVVSFKSKFNGKKKHSILK